MPPSPRPNGSATVTETNEVLELELSRVARPEAELSSRQRGLARAGVHFRAEIGAMLGWGLAPRRLNYAERVRQKSARADGAAGARP